MAHAMSVLAVGTALCVGALLLQPSPTEACVVMVPAEVEPQARPSLSQEQVLIVFDDAKHRQHFIREVAFRKANTTFGFVVPTPTRPEVESVEEPPFSDLQVSFPFSALGSVGMARSAAAGLEPAAADAPVQVLETKKVGSFTAFVLAATDDAALASWLKDNGLVSRPDADAWLKQLVQMKFFYVAMRYDPPKGTNAAGDGEVQSETIRISFDTPMPYYPYREPDAPSGEAAQDRTLDLWYVGREPVTPLSLLLKPGNRQWVQPLASGEQYDDARAALDGVLPNELDEIVPAGSLVVQTFEDHKVSREGFGDILFVPRKRRALTAADKAELEPLLAILDPTLLEVDP